MAKNLSVNKNFLLFLSLVSLATSPLIVSFFALYFGNQHEIEKNPDYFITFLIVGFLLPASIRLIQALRFRVELKFLGILNKDNRDPVYLAALFSLVLCYILFSSENLDNVVWFNVSLLLAIYIGLFFIVNRFFHKASQHAGTFVLSIIFLAIKLDAKILILLCFLPLIWISRYYLKAHTYIELILGTLIGLLVGVLSVNMI